MQRCKEKVYANMSLGVQCNLTGEERKYIHEQFAKMVPNDAEVVVGYGAQLSVSNHFIRGAAVGTALIPRKR